MIRESTRINVKDFFEALEKGARSALGVATACATAGIIVGVVTKTGIGLKLASALIVVANNVANSFGNLVKNVYDLMKLQNSVSLAASVTNSTQLMLTLFMAMLTSIILGMGVPTTANYIITSTVAAPALLMLSVKPIAAHLFVFYFGIVADITPPVALAAYAGAAIAKANPLKTGVIATRLAIGAFIIPYMFVLSPQLLLIGGDLLHLILAIFTAIVGMVSISAALSRYLIKPLNRFETLILIFAGLMLIDPNIITDIIGIALVFIIGFWQKIVERTKISSTKN